MKITKQIIAILIVFSIIYSAQCLQVEEDESISQQIRNFGTFTLQHIELISQAKKTDKKAEGAEKKDETAEKKTEGETAEKKTEGETAEKPAEGAEKKDEGAEKKDARHQQKKTNNKNQKKEEEKKNETKGETEEKKTETKGETAEKKTETKGETAEKKTESARHQQKKTNNKNQKQEGEEKTEDEKKAEGADVKKTVGAEKTETPVEGADVKKVEGADVKKIDSKKLNNTNNTIPFFKGQKIELPLYCKADQATSKLSKPELVSIAQEAQKFVGNWNKASGEESPFNALKDLDDKKFAVFYKEITTGLPEQDSTVKASEAEAESKNLLISVLFGDDKRTSVSWLEFWIYMCSGGIKPSKDQYMKSTKPKTAKNEAVKTEEKPAAEKTEEKPAEGEAVKPAEKTEEKPAEGEAAKEARLNKKRNLLKKNSH